MTIPKAITGAFAVMAVLAGPVAAQEQDEVFQALSENVQKIVLAVNEHYTDLDGVCDAEVEDRRVETNRLVKELQDSGEVVGFGFYALEAGAYYQQACRDR